MAPKLHQMIDAISEELVKSSNGTKLFTRLGIMEHVSVTHHLHHRKNVKNLVNARMMMIVGLIMVCKMVIAGNSNHK